MAIDKLQELQEERVEIGKWIEERAKTNTDDWSAEDKAEWDRKDGRYIEIGEEIENLRRKVQVQERAAQIADTSDRIQFEKRTEVGERRWERTEEETKILTPETRNDGLRGFFLLPVGQAGEKERRACELLGWNPINPTLSLNFGKRIYNDDPSLPPVKNFRMFVENYYRELRQLQAAELRQQGTTPDTAGGYLVPDEMIRPIEIALLQFGGMRQAGTTFTTATGADLPWPTVSDASVKGEIISENSAHNEQDVTFGQIVYTTYQFSSKIVRVSGQLLQDSATNIPQLLGRLLGERIGRIQNEKFTVGTGTAEPFGLLAATNGATDSGVTLGAADAPTYDNVIDLKHSVDPAYREAGMGSFMFHDRVLAAMKKITDSQGMPIWRTGLAPDAPDTIDGDPYFINQDFPTGVGAKTMTYGAHSKYQIRDATGFDLRRSEHRYWEFNQVAWLGIQRSDGRLLDAGTNPVKFASNP